MGWTAWSSECGAKPTQEDRVVAERLAFGDKSVWILGVFDGHVGERAADACARALPETVAELWTQRADVESVVREAVDTLAQIADGADPVDPDGWQHPSGTTLSVAVIDEAAGEAGMAVVGDSPIVAFGASGSWIGPWHRAWDNEAERAPAVDRGGVFEQGYMWNAQTPGVPDKSRGALLLTRALGSRGFEFLDRTPETSRLSIDDSTFILIGSDGLLVHPEHRDREGFASYVAGQVESGWSAIDFVADAITTNDRDNVSAVSWSGQQR